MDWIKKLKKKEVILSLIIFIFFFFPWLSNSNISGLKLTFVQSKSIIGIPILAFLNISMIVFVKRNRSVLFSSGIFPIIVFFELYQRFGKEFFYRISIYAISILLASILLILLSFLKEN